MEDTLTTDNKDKFHLEELQQSKDTTMTNPAWKNCGQSRKTTFGLPSFGTLTAHEASRARAQYLEASDPTRLVPE